MIEGVSMEICKICGAELRTKQGYHGHMRFLHDPSGAGRGGRIYTVVEGSVRKADLGEGGMTLPQAQQLEINQQILQTLLRIKASLERGA